MHSSISPFRLAHRCRRHDPVRGQRAKSSIVRTSAIARDFELPSARALRRPVHFVPDFCAMSLAQEERAEHQRDSRRDERRPHSAYMPFELNSGRQTTRRSPSASRSAVERVRSSCPPVATYSKFPMQIPCRADTRSTGAGVAFFQKRAGCHDSISKRILFARRT
jgi:hypothetical protein